MCVCNLADRSSVVLRMPVARLACLVYLPTAAVLPASCVICGGGYMCIQWPWCLPRVDALLRAPSQAMWL